MTVEFHIINGQDTLQQLPLHEILQDYADTNIPVKKIKEKYQLTQTQWNHIIRHCKNKNIPLRGTTNKNKPLGYKPRYYYHNGHGRYYVSRIFDGERYNFGTYPTEKQAKKRVEELHQNKCEGHLE